VTYRLPSRSTATVSEISGGLIKIGSSQGDDLPCVTVLQGAEPACVPSDVECV
jgi:hypothetical protein